MSKQIAFKKIKIRRSLGVVREVVEVAKYYNREDADNCALDGDVYPVVNANFLLKQHVKKED